MLYSRRQVGSDEATGAVVGRETAGVDVRNEGANLPAQGRRTGLAPQEKEESSAAFHTDGRQRPHKDHRGGCCGFVLLASSSCRCLRAFEIIV